MDSLFCEYGMFIVFFFLNLREIFGVVRKVIGGVDVCYD